MNINFKENRNLSTYANKIVDDFGFIWRKVAPVKFFKTKFQDQERCLVDTTNNSLKNLDQTKDTTKCIVENLECSYEIEIANAVFNLSSYATDYKVTLTGIFQWSHTKPDCLLSVINGANNMLEGDYPLLMVMGPDVWKALGQNSFMLKETGNLESVETKKRFLFLFKRTVYKERIIRLPSIKEVEAVISSLFKRPVKILVGYAQYYSLEKGTTPCLEYIWGKNCAFLPDDGSFIKSEATKYKVYRKISKKSQIKVMNHVEAEVVDKKKGYLLSDCV